MIILSVLCFGQTVVSVTAPHFYGHLALQTTHYSRKQEEASYLPTTREGNVFTGVCHSVHNRPHGYSITAHPGYSVVGTHPTGMLSCRMMYITRMHSSRMHTARSSSHQGGLHQAPWTMHSPRSRHPPGPCTPPPWDHAPPRGQTHACKHITLPQTSFADGNYNELFPRIEIQLASTYVHVCCICTKLSGSFNESQ